MESEFVSLFFVVLAALAAPILAAIVPKKLFPETVFFLVLGMILGPNVAGLIQIDNALSLLSDLGLAFLFLLAGYEIQVDELTGRRGRHGLVTWAVSFAITLAVMVPISLYRGNILGGFAAAIILTTTAFGTLVPIMAERGLSSTPIGSHVTAYGVWGELCPVLAMALLLTTRARWLTILLLIAFVCIAVLAALLSRHAGRKSIRLVSFIEANADTNSQIRIRAVVVLLVGLVMLAAEFQLDVVLGAFAAGFVLRAIMPEGSDVLERKLAGIGYGFFIPLFFIVSGAAIDPVSIAAEPLLLLLFVIALLLVRAVPIYISLRLQGSKSGLSRPQIASVALYCTTALPLIVAVSTVATSAGIISSSVASVLVAAGGVSVLVMPLLASCVSEIMDSRQDLEEASLPK